MSRKDSFEVNDFNQGQISHNYILAYLRQLAVHKERVQKILVTREINAACIYRVKFFINGLRTSVVVDDFIPIDEST